MELKFFIGPAVSFVLALIAFVPLVKYRLKATEEITEKQKIDIQKNKDKSHELELLILQNEKDSNSKSMNKMADALLLVAESNSKFQSIIESQTVLIQRAHDGITRVHTRIDAHVKENQHELDDFRKDTNKNFKEFGKEYVSHPFLKEALKDKS